MTDAGKVERDRLFGDPKNSLFAILDNEADLDAVKKDLSTAGVQGDAVKVFGSKPAADRLAEREQERGFGTKVREVLSSEVVEIERKYAEAVDAGRYVLQVKLKDEDEAARERVKQILMAHSAHFIHYFGRWSFKGVAVDER